MLQNYINWICLSVEICLQLPEIFVFSICLSPYLPSLPTVARPRLGITRRVVLTFTCVLTVLSDWHVAGLITSTTEGRAYTLACHLGQRPFHYKF